MFCGCLILIFLSASTVAGESQCCQIYNGENSEEKKERRNNSEAGALEMCVSQAMVFTHFFWKKKQLEIYILYDTPVCTLLFQLKMRVLC